MSQSVGHRRKGATAAFVVEITPGKTKPLKIWFAIRQASVNIVYSDSAVYSIEPWMKQSETLDSCNEAKFRCRMITLGNAVCAERLSLRLTIHIRRTSLASSVMPHCSCGLDWDCEGKLNEAFFCILSVVCWIPYVCVVHMMCVYIARVRVYHVQYPLVVFLSVVFGWRVQVLTLTCLLYVS